MISLPRPFRAIAALAVGFIVTAGQLSAAEPTSEKAAPSPTSPAAVAGSASTKTEPAADSDVVGNSVVKVFSTMRYPDPYRPWTKQAPADVTGSGVVIEGKRILTNAHVVLYASQVQIQANQSGDKLSATVEMVAPGIDLAILKLDDESFFDSHAPVTRANTLPDIKDTVLAYGFPTGGSSLSITKGIVSRIEFTPYNYPVSGLRIQIDAAINPGNSGGPALVGDKMIGLAFSRFGGGDNIGYIIPNEEIELFLADCADGHYDGKPALFDEFQTLENPALRAFLKIDKSVSGLVVHHPLSDDAADPLKKWDVITHIGDTPIDDQGMILIGHNLRVGCGYLIQKIAKQGKLPLTVVRAGKELKVEMDTHQNHPLLIADVQGEYPPYFVYGPLVFSKATVPFLSFFNNNAGSMVAFSFIHSPLVARRGDTPAFPGEELVVVASPFFPHKLAKGYSNPSGSVVYSVNGTVVKNLAHLVTLLRDLKDDYVTFEFQHRGGETMVFPRKDMVAATEDILTDNGVRAQASPEMLALWNAKQK
ncbi:MAG TPA: trypsin-like peptidase domain-containing protein [Lacunisphaera sp.]|jgi:S1-C subfamily serine protease